MSSPSFKLKDRSYSYVWKISIACFILAGLTGFLFRLGMLGWSGGLNIANIRHAHSHLMFFGWAVPIPMLILMLHIKKAAQFSQSGLKWMRNSLISSLIFGILSYPFFLFYGYKPVGIGSAALPFSVIAAGCVMISWYGYIIGYLKNRKFILQHKPTAFFDASLIMLFLCSLGAWGIAVVQFLGPENHLLMKALTHFFLSTFTEGWLVLALIAVIALNLIPSADFGKTGQAALAFIAIGAPLTFPYGIAESLMSPTLLFAARAGGIMIAAGTLTMIYQIMKSGESVWGVWKWPLLFLAVKAIMQAAASVIPSDFWLSDHGLRIFYLHVLLLGAFTTAMIAWISEQTGTEIAYFNIVAASISATLLSLLLPTALFPAEWSGIWIIKVLAVFALLPVIGVTLHFFRALAKHKNQEKTV